MPILHRIYPNRNEVAQEYTNLVKQFVETKYPREEYIKCFFDLYEVYLPAEVYDHISTAVK